VILRVSDFRRYEALHKQIDPSIYSFCLWSDLDFKDMED